MAKAALLSTSEKKDRPTGIFIRSISKLAVETFGS